MKFYNSLLKSLVLAILINTFSASGVAHAQKSDTRLRMANLFKNSGNYEQALELYLSIYKEGKLNRPLIDNIIRCYEQLKRYQALERFLGEIIKKLPDDVEYRVKLGKVFYLVGNRQKAFEYWQNLIKKYKNNGYLYRVLGNVLIDLRLYDKAIDIYQQAIKNTNAQFILYRDIAMLHRAQLDFGNAALNYLYYLEHFPRQFAYIHSQIIAMSSDSTAVLPMIKTIEAYRKKHPDRAGITEILADLYLRNKDFKKAYAIYLELDRRSPKSNYLFRFIQKAAQNHAYNYAIKGLKLLIKKSKSPSEKQRYQMELARNYYRQARFQSAKNAQQSVKKALKLIEQLQKAKPKTSYANQALELRGDIYLNFYQDTDRAIADYQNLLKNTGWKKHHDRVRFKLVQSYLIKGDLKRAQQLLKKISSPTYRNMVQFLQAEIQFYSGNLNAALQLYQQLSVRLSPEDSLANNVLQRMLLLGRAASDSTLLKDYGRAEFLIRQKKLSEAARIFERLAEQRSALSPHCAERAIELLKKLNKWEEAEALSRKAITNFPDYSNLDRLIFTLARIREKRGQFKEAFQAYRLIITQFPNSFYLEEARDRARKIREQIKEVQVP